MKTTLLLAITLTLTSSITFAGKSKKSTSFESAYSSSSSKQESDMYRVSGGALSALAGILSVKGEYLLNDKMAVGVDLSYTSKDTEPLEKDSTIKTYHFTYSEYNLGFNYMITGTNTSDGFYINPKVGQLNSGISNFSDLNLSGSASSSQLVVTGGYQWVYPTKFQLKLGLGARATPATDIVIYDSSKKEVYRDSSSLNSAAVDCSLAYTF